MKSWTFLFFIFSFLSVTLYCKFEISLDSSVSPQQRLTLLAVKGTSFRKFHMKNEMSLETEKKEYNAFSQCPVWTQLYTLYSIGGPVTVITQLFYLRD